MNKSDQQTRSPATGVILLILRFAIYGLLFFGIAMFIAYQPYSSTEELLKLCSAVGAVGAAMTALAAYCTRLLVRFYTELLGAADE